VNLYEDQQKKGTKNHPASARGSKKTISLDTESCWANEKSLPTNPKGRRGARKKKLGNHLRRAGEKNTNDLGCLGEEMKPWKAWWGSSKGAGGVLGRRHIIIPGLWGKVHRGKKKGWGIWGGGSLWGV